MNACWPGDGPGGRSPGVVRAAATLGPGSFAYHTDLEAALWYQDVCADLTAPGGALAGLIAPERIEQHLVAAAAAGSCREGVDTEIMAAAYSGRGEGVDHDRYRAYVVGEQRLVRQVGEAVQVQARGGLSG